MDWHKIYCYTKISYFLPYDHSRSKIKDEIGLSSYATAPDLKSTTGVDTLQFAKNVD